MELRRLRYFVVLARELHFTRAAQELRIAQPALSQQIRVLEREVGARLIDRPGRRGPGDTDGSGGRGGGCALTEVGRLVAAEAVVLLAQADAAQRRIEAAARGQGGRIRVAYTRSARGGVVDALIDRFRVQNPQVEVVAETGWTAPNVAGLLADRFDVAFVRPPLDEPSLTCRFVGSEELLLAVPAGHRLAGGPPGGPLGGGRGRVRREELVGEPAVMWPRENGPGMYDRIVGQIWPDGAGFVLVRHEPDDEQLLRAVAAGGVVAVVPAGRARALRLPGVRLRRFAGPVPTVDIALAYRPKSAAPVVLRLVALLDE